MNSLLLGALAAPALGLENGLARTPPMGWLSWERFGCNTDCDAFPNTCISEKLYMDMAHALVDLGLADLGYRYVNIDDCWSELKRESNGQLMEDLTRFPSGMRSLSDKVHGLGLLFGMYTDIGTMTCGGYPGLAPNFTVSDLAQFADAWQIDSLKVDGCYADVKQMKKLYSDLGDALNKTGRPILYSCSWPAYQETDHCENAVDMQTLVSKCNLWRNFADVYDSWSSVRGIVDFWARNNSESIFVKAAGPGHWNDPDMLLVGNPGLSISEQRAQFALWAILAAPLYISADLREIKAESLAILKNEEVIQINQDPLGKQGHVLSSVGDYRIWVRPLSPKDGMERVAVLFENRGSIFGLLRFRFNVNQLGWASAYTVRDVHAHSQAEYTQEDVFVVDVDESSVELFIFAKKKNPDKLLLLQTSEEEIVVAIQ